MNLCNVTFLEVTCYNTFLLRSILHGKAICRKKDLSRIVPLFRPSPQLCLATDCTEKWNLDEIYSRDEHYCHV